MAYWDTEQGGARPRLLGEIQGTPTIRLYKPKPKQGNSNTKKVVLDYNQERKAKDMKRFLDYSMPNFVERPKGEEGLQAFEEKALRNGLPRAILFSSKEGVKPLTKYLSTQFRRRLLLGQVDQKTPNQAVIDKYGITEFPALVVIPAPPEEGGDEPEVIRYDGKTFSKAKLEMFLSTHALKKEVEVKKKKPAEAEETKEEPKKDSVKSEL